MVAERLKALRAEKHITQVQLAEMLGVSKGTVAMWETGKRKPNFDALATMTEIFDRRMDYILGYSDDTSSPFPSEEDIEQLGSWELEDQFHSIIMKYLQLDDYGKLAVENLIGTEYKRCRDQETTLPTDHIQLKLKISNN